MLIACPTCGRLQFDMDTVVADIERRLEAYEDPIEVAVLGCAVNGIGEASHADFGITGAKNEGLIFSPRQGAEEGPDGAARRRAVQGDRQVRPGAKRIDVDAARGRRGRGVAAAIEEENAGELTPERLAELEAEQAEEADEMSDALLETVAERTRLDEAASPTAGRRFTRA